MELTRRDALAVLAAGGAGSLAGCAAPRASDDSTGKREGEAATVGDHEMETLAAVAEVVYPSAVGGVSEFVRTYTGGRVDGEYAYARGVAAAVESLDGYTEEFHGDRYAALPASARREVLDYMSVDVVEPAPDGTAAQRVRYYVVNELLYAFYTSPTGAGLAGLENPPGHPGGTESYREGPNE